MALHEGKVAEMKTGEGKTLVAVFVGLFKCIRGKGGPRRYGNDYLAQRDASWRVAFTISRFIGRCYHQ